ncbi:cytochrome oxidase complex assembly protein 1 [Tenacibaculum adriaticum]|uniref:Cytochrome oxidase complex assembly protein 1 n=1 Tax=Tenacibaculum adriaticum TaxID=413713 RepID=A0A5S5DVY0_9FLAO|nr:cytochrome c oxidase assembly factor Coa1 family protein [Tenacibaculum adriaticum]TYP99995.1 cytochrome oxidase complex assembly protein 1 [Tenacibaculum adriaticum]
MEEYQERSWFSKNWPWALPLGCCSGCLLLFILFIGGIGTAVFGVFSELKEATPIEEILITVNKNPKATAILGTNIVSDGFPSGNISLNNNDREVAFTIPVKGSKVEGVLTVNGIRVDKKWFYEDLYVTIKETQEQINLLEKALEDF